MNLFAKLTVILAWWPFLHLGAERFNRFEHIREWAVTEEKIYGLAKAHLTRLEREAIVLKNFVKDYEETTIRHLEGMSNLEMGENGVNFRGNVVASNPLLVHRMSHRLVTEVPKIQKIFLAKDKEGKMLKETLAAFADPNILGENVTKEFRSILGSRRDHFPTDLDLDDSVESLAILYDTYQYLNLTPDNFAANLSPETTKPIVINAYHAVQISIRAIYRGLYGNAMDWIRYAMNRASKIEIRDWSISKDIIQYTGEFMRKSHNTELEKDPALFPPSSHLTPLNFYNGTLPETSLNSRGSAEETRTKFRRLLQEELESGSGSVHITAEQELALSYYNLCEKGQHFSVGEGELLKCYLDGIRHPYFTLRPLKVEEISGYSNVKRFHDILEQGEIARIQKFLETKPFLTLGGVDRHKPDLNGTRRLPESTGAMSEIEYDVESEVLKALSRKVGLLSGHTLHTDMEPIIVTEYVAGRYQMLQQLPADEIDPFEALLQFESEVEPIGATLQFELTSLEKGGESLLGPYGPAVTPIQGSVLYWEPIRRGQVTWTGSCPVRKGHKLTISVGL